MSEGNERRLVVLASGWTKPDWLWYPMATRFEKAGYDTLTIGYHKQGYGCIRESANKAASLLEVVLPQYDRTVFIGHSMGGIVGRTLIQEMGFHFDAYVSIASPHSGVRFGWVMKPFSQSAYQMWSGSSFMTALNAAPWPTDIPALALQSQWEFVVTPKSSAVFSHGENQEIPHSEHAFITTYERTFQEIFGWLTYGVFNEVFEPDRSGFSSSASEGAHAEATIETDGVSVTFELPLDADPD